MEPRKIPKAWTVVLWVVGIAGLFGAISTFQHAAQPVGYWFNPSYEIENQTTQTVRIIFLVRSSWGIDVQEPATTAYVEARASETIVGPGQKVKVRLLVGEDEPDFTDVLVRAEGGGYGIYPISNPDSLPSEIRIQPGLKPAPEELIRAAENYRPIGVPWGITIGLMFAPLAFVVLFVLTGFWQGHRPLEATRQRTLKLWQWALTFLVAVFLLAPTYTLAAILLENRIVAMVALVAVSLAGTWGLGKAIERLREGA